MWRNLSVRNCNGPDDWSGVAYWADLGINLADEGVMYKGRRSESQIVRLYASGKMAGRDSSDP